MGEGGGDPEVRLPRKGHFPLRGGRVSPDHLTSVGEDIPGDVIIPLVNRLKLQVRHHLSDMS